MKENLHKNFLLTNISNENIEWEENSLPLHHCLLHPLQYLAPPSNRARVTIITNNSLCINRNMTGIKPFLPSDSKCVEEILIYNPPIGFYNIA